MAEGRSIGFTFYARDQFDAVARRVSGSMDRIRDSMDRVGQASGRVNARANRANADWAKFAVNAKRLAATYFGAQTVRHILSETASAETALLKVMSAIRDPADQKLYGAKIDAIIRANRALGHSADEVAESLALQFRNLGVSEQSLAAYTEAARFATATFEPLGSVVAGVAKIIEQFPQTAADPRRITSAFFTTRSQTGDFGGLLSTLPQVSPFAAKAGLSFEKQMAMFVAMENKLKTPGMTGAAQEQLLRFLMEPGSRDQTRLAKLHKIIRTPEGFREAGIEAQLQRLGKLYRYSPGEFGQLGLGGQAAKFVSTMTQADINRMGEIESMIRDDFEQDTLGAQFAKVQETLSASMQSATSAMKDLGVVIGTELAPGVKTIASAVGWLAGNSKTKSVVRHLFRPEGDLKPGEYDTIGSAVIPRRRRVRPEPERDPGARPER